MEQKITRTLLEWRLIFGGHKIKVGILENVFFFSLLRALRHV